MTFRTTLRRFFRSGSQAQSVDAELPSSSLPRQGRQGLLTPQDILSNSDSPTTDHHRGFNTHIDGVQPVSNQEMPTIQRLPPEILLIVMSYVRGYTHRDLVVVCRSASLAYPMNRPEEVARPGSVRLLHATRVCRSWYQAAVPVLYAYPALLSRQSIHLFAQTLKANPTLANLAKALLVANCGYYIFRNANDKKAKEKANKDEKLQECLVRDLTSILTACASLEEMIFQNESSHFRGSRILDTIQLSDALHNQLRKLTVLGTLSFRPEGIGSDGPEPGIGSSTIEQHRLFSHLQVLCFRGDFLSPLSGASRFPCLPMLQTLQIVGGNRENLLLVDGNHGLGEFVSSANMPSLCNIELYYTTFSLIVPPDTWKNLKRLHTIGFISMRTLPLTMSHTQSTGGGALAILALGPVIPKDKEIVQAWTFPPRLKSLTILIGLPVGIAIIPRHADGNLMMAIHKALSNNLPQMRLLDTVTLKFWPSSRADIPERSGGDIITDEIKVLCEENKISFRMTFECELRIFYLLLERLLTGVRSLG